MLCRLGADGMKESRVRKVRRVCRQFDARQENSFVEHAGRLRHMREEGLDEVFEKI